jgi:hypothetical protein
VAARAALAVAIAAAARVALGAPGPDAALEIENEARGRALRVPLRDGEVFAVTSIHSMYDAPVTEEFVIEGDGFRLDAVSSPSAAAREYLGITAAGARHAASRRLREIVFRVAEGSPQRLRAAGVERSFLELGDHGDRLVFRAVRTTIASPGAPRAPPR